MSAPNANRTDAGHLSSLRAQLVKRSTDMPTRATREEAAAQLRALDAVLADRERLDALLDDTGPCWVIQGVVGDTRYVHTREEIDAAHAAAEMPHA